MVRPAPERIAAALRGHAAARWLAVAVALGVFTELGRGPRTLEQLVRRLGLQPAPARDLMDALVALGFVERDGNDPAAVYLNSREAGLYLDDRSPASMAPWLAACDAALGGADPAALALLRDPPATDRVDSALEAERHLAAWCGAALAEDPALRQARRVVVAHGGAGRFLEALAADAPALEGLSLEAATDLADARAHLAPHAPRLQAGSIDAAWPTADLVVVHRIGSLPAPQAAVQRAAEAAGPTGRICLVDFLVDAERRHAAAALLVTLARRRVGAAVATIDVAQLVSACRAVGLTAVEVVPLPAGATAVCARRPGA